MRYQARVLLPFKILKEGSRTSKKKMMTHFLIMTMLLQEDIP